MNRTSFSRGRGQVSQRASNFVSATAKKMASSESDESAAPVTRSRRRVTRGASVTPHVSSPGGAFAPTAAGRLDPACSPFHLLLLGRDDFRGRSG